MATKNLNPITRSATVLAAIEQMRAEAKAAKKAAAKANDPLALIEAAKASTVANGDAEKALWKEYWLARIDELNVEVADVRKKLADSGGKWSELIDDANTKRGAVERGNENIHAFSVDQLTAAYKAWIVAEKAVIALREEREPWQDAQRRLWAEIDEARTELAKLQPKPAAKGLTTVDVFGDVPAGAVLEGL